jgi:hypothetical protein
LGGKFKPEESGFLGVWGCGEVFAGAGKDGVFEEKMKTIAVFLIKRCIGVKR